MIYTPSGLKGTIDKKIPLYFGNLLPRSDYTPSQFNAYNWAGIIATHRDR
jgi:hypothetical protein